MEKGHLHFGDIVLRQ